MLKKIFKGLAFGTSWGCTVLTFMGIFFVGRGSGGIDSATYLKYVLASVIIGIGFTMPAEFVYESERLSRPLQVLIHLGTGTIIYMTVALWCGWIPTQAGALAIIFTIIADIAVSLLIWLCFFLYYKWNAKKMNEKIKSTKKN